MTEQQPAIFYSSKPRLVHIGLNIALAPGLLYLFGLWSLPPTLPHYIMFFITGLIAHRFVRQRWDRPRLIIDDTHIDFGEQIPIESIDRVERFMRALKVQYSVEGTAQEKVIGLSWASNADFRSIVALVDQRIGLSPRE